MSELIMVNKKNENKSTVGAMNPPAVTQEVYSAEMLKELDKHAKAIKTALSGIDKNFAKIAFNLYWIYETGTYKAMGCDSIADYASKQFDIQKTSTYNFIAIVDRFGKRDENGHVMDCFDDKYKDFSSSKLSLISELTEVEIEELGIVPTMSVREIKKAVKEYLESGLPVDEDAEESVEDEDAEESVEDEDIPEIVSNVLITCKGIEDYNSKIDKIDALIMNLLKKHPDYQIEISYKGIKEDA